jgi:tRNA(Ile)-lysidine synthase
LARLIHGAGTEGLAGLPPVEGNRVRPLIDVRRTETGAYCRARSLQFFDDPANADPRYDRTPVRHEIVRTIESIWGDGAIRAMAVSAERLREDATALNRLAERIFQEIATPSEDGIRFRLDAVEVLPRAVLRRLLEQSTGRVRDRSGGIDAALDALDAKKRNVSFAVAQGREIRIGAHDVVVRQSHADPSEP